MTRHEEQLLYPHSRTPDLTESDIAHLDKCAHAVGLPRWTRASIAGKLEILAAAGRHPRGRWAYRGIAWRNRRYADAYAALDAGESATDRATTKTEALTEVARLRAWLVREGYTLAHDEPLSVAGQRGWLRAALTYTPIDGGYVGVEAG